ncbi:exodeoxyribonuclease VII large subunit [Paludibacterium yongneupense]|uniref:exodeoxyribonuclease VII large subunit n=1 Tax=Paludibacterium yongneupense TaxID=400061 RepID=UPI000417CCA1|nr:exodeoxyribonuclease VII large subunit [Paludibacterium yongneupense]
MLFNASPDDVISVSTLNRMTRELLENGLPPRWIGGEISNLTLAASGHAYFSLKDGSAQIRCVMFRQRVSHLAFRPQDGMQVELKGLVTLYEARGEYQINVESMRSAGLGRLYEAFERLKAKLASEGLFEEARKRELPGHPARVGIVTSPAAAALRDVATTLRRRMPGIEVILYPTPVQGEGAAQRIAAAIDLAARRRETDVLIVCRGGGSIEDLWSFNEEIVARAIVACPIPVVSGVGHETDFTICDFVADRRAPTPTAAAEMVSPKREHLQGQLDQARRGLERALSRLLTDKAQRLDFLSRRLKHPGERLTFQAQRLGQAAMQLEARIGAVFSQRRWALQLAASRLRGQRPHAGTGQRRIEEAEARLQQAMARLIERRQHELHRLGASLEAMNPNAVLARGYAIVRKANGQAAKSPQELRQGERVQLHLAEGQTDAIVDHRPGKQDELPF